MRSIFIFAVLLVSAFTLKATHNRAGEITYKRILPYYDAYWQPVYNYSITLITYTDDGPIVADRCVDTIFFGDGSKLAAQRINGLAGSCCGGSIGCGELIINQSGYKVKKNIYTATHTYAGPGTYLIQLFDPNRNNGVANIPNSVDQLFYLETLLIINPVSEFNSSPVLTNPPIDLGFLNTCYYHNPAAFDADGDSLSYELTVCKGSGGQPIAGYTYPATGAGGSLGIDAYGFLSWCNPQAIGEFNMAFIVKEWRKPSPGSPYQVIGYVTRDLQVVIRAGVPETFSAVPLSDTCIAAGSVLARSFKASSLANVDIKLYGAVSAGQSVASINPASGSATVSTAFAWQPGCDMARRLPHQVYIVYTPQGFGPANRFYRRFDVKVVPPVVQIHSIEADSGKVTVRWKKSDCQGNIYNYNVYRKMGPNTWSHGPCEPGVPASSGFHMIGYTQLTDTSFTDTYISQYANGSSGNYLITAVTKDGAESFADGIRSVAIITGIKQLQADANAVSVYPNPFNEQLEITLSNTQAANVQVSLFATDGKLVYDQAASTSDGKLIVKQQDLAPGIYLLRLKTSEGMIYKKTVKE